LNPLLQHQHQAKGADARHRMYGTEAGE
jgi:hypothetical protein